ncbi:hypothetical protein [Psychrobacter sp.]|uniref:hypothetical protein n=1 Tax=Psychrobacter sp. TaxID=56811 RepID=UPI0025FEAE38|nr:hypothetical protein [Psychrobacter sp.]
MTEHTDQFTESRSMTRLAGIFIMIVAAATLFFIFTINAETVPRIYVVLPFFLMLGLGIMLFPISKAESLHLYGTTQMPFKHMPLGLKACIIMGALFSVVLLIL